MCSPSGNVPAVSGGMENISPSAMNSNGTPAPPMPVGAETATGPATTASASPLFAAMFALQAAQVVGGAYGNRQNWRAQQYVDNVHRDITKKNADLSFKAASEQQSLAEVQDRKAEAVDTLTTKVNELKTRSSLKVMAGESGLTGSTPGDILADADRITAARLGILEMNYRSRTKERLAQRKGLAVNYQNNRTGANTPYRPDPNNYGAMGLEIAGQGLNTYMDYQAASRRGAE